MVWNAPSWSDLAPQFMHGFPRRLVAAAHGGFLEGNVCVAAKVSNQSMRSLATGDIAAFCSQQALSNLGLTMSELFMARKSALSYSGKSKLPSRLVQVMVRFGVDLLTFSPLDADSLATLTRHTAALQQNHLTWVPAGSDDGDCSSSEEEEVELDSAVVCSRLSVHDSQLLQSDSSRYQTALVKHFLGGEGEGVSSPSRASRRREGPQGGATIAGVGSSGRRKRRRRQAVGAEEAGNAAEGGQPEQEENRQQEQRERLAGVAGVALRYVPEGSSLGHLRDFLSKHRPLSRANISAAAEGTTDTALEEAARRLGGERLAPAVRESLQAIWDLAKRECTCLPAPEGPSSLSASASPSERCPYRSSDARREPINPALKDCTATNCIVCQFFAVYQEMTKAAIHTGLNKSVRLQAMVTAGTYMAELAWSEAVATIADGPRQLKARFAELLCCKEDKVHCVLAVGYLAKFLPQLADVWLSSGWGMFWRELRKVGTSLFYQGTDEARWSVLAFIRETCLEADSSWHYYLSPRQEEA